MGITRAAINSWMDAMRRAAASCQQQLWATSPSLVSLRYVTSVIPSSSFFLPSPEVEFNTASNAWASIKGL